MQGKQDNSIFFVILVAYHLNKLFSFDAKVGILIIVIIISNCKQLVEVFVIFLIRFSSILEDTLFVYLSENLNNSLTA